jgi:hypothetical protein
VDRRQRQMCIRDSSHFPFIFNSHFSMVLSK